MSTLINHHDEVTDQSQQVLLIRKRQTTPDRSWKYIDKAGKINGPFSTPEILEWWEKGYLRPGLMMNCDEMHGNFSPLRVLYPNPGNAFVTSPQIPIDEDAMSVASTASTAASSSSSCRIGASRMSKQYPHVCYE